PSPCLAGTRRYLDEEIAAVERRGHLAQLAEVGRLDRRARPGEAGPRSREDVGQRRIAAVAGQHRSGESGERRALLVGVVRLRRDERAGQRDRREAGAAPEDEHARRFVHELDRPGWLSRGGIDRHVTRGQLVLLGWEAEAVVQRALGRNGPGFGSKPPDRFGVLEQLVTRHLAAREEPPPGGAHLATV